MSKRQKTKSVKRQVEYIPPDDPIIENFARNVCEKLPPKGKQKAFSNSMQRDFTAFVKAVAHIQANHLNRQQAARKNNDQK